MSFHIDTEQIIPSLILLPSSRPNSTWRLAEVLGRLGIVFSYLCQPMEDLVMEQRHDKGLTWHGGDQREEPGYDGCPYHDGAFDLQQV
jgi:hypothetical protein